MNLGSKFRVIISKRLVVFHIFFALIVLYLLLPSYIIGLLPTFLLLALRYISMLFMLLYVVLYGFKTSAAFWLIVCSSVLGIVSTVLNSGAVLAISIEYVYIIFECAFLVSLIRNEKRCSAFMTVVRNLTLAFSLINLMVGIVMPTGIPSITTTARNPHFLYGNLNSTMRSVMPGLCCSLLIDKRNKKTISLFTILLVFSVLYFCFRIYFMATTFVGLVLLMAWVLLETPNKHFYRKTYLGIVIVTALIEFFVVFMNGHSKYSNMISGLFSMKSGFTGREMLWSNVIYRIQNKLLVGYGYLSSDTMKRLIGNVYGSHNYYLDLVFIRGLIGFAPILLLFLLPVFCRRDSISSECYILIGICGAYLVMFLMEPFIGTENLHLPIICIAMTSLIHSSKTTGFRIRIKHRRGMMQERKRAA